MEACGAISSGTTRMKMEDSIVRKQSFPLSIELVHSGCCIFMRNICERTLGSRNLG